MKTSTLKRLALACGLATMLAAPIVNAQTSVSFEPFKSEDLANSDLDYINIDATIYDTGTGVRICIENNSVPGDGWITEQNPAVARVYFDGSSAYLPTAPTFDSVHSSDGVKFKFGGSPNDLPGGTEIGFDSDFRFASNNPAPEFGINAGEMGCFLFEGADYDEVLRGLQNGDVRIGLHIISAGPNGEESYAFVNKPIPEPASALLGALGMLLLFRRRR